ncbi:MAG TPA: hypothetical protein VKN82_02880, partial [Desulfohalobiaceae bacterium]|nr:hypothetical protein [Desulfohalobiaceae bacterium]
MLKIVSFLFLSSLLMVFPLQAKENKQQEPFQLSPMTVIAPQRGVKITPEKTVIDMDKFTKPGGVDTLEDVLHEIGGIDVQRSNPLIASPGDQISIRGVTEGRLVVEIDGRR